MNKINLKHFLILLSLIFTNIGWIPASKALDFSEALGNFPIDINSFGSTTSVYPEAQYRKINVTKAQSDLDDEAPEIPNTHAVAAATANIFKLGTGVVNVTKQVHDGTKTAMVEVFKGYPEFQRRKIAEEVVNASFAAHQITSAFMSFDKELVKGGQGFDSNESTGSTILELLGLDRLYKSVKRTLENIYQRAKEIFAGTIQKYTGNKTSRRTGFDMKLNNNDIGQTRNFLRRIDRIMLEDPHIEDLQTIFSFLSTFLLFTVIGMIVIQRIGSGDISYTFGEPFVKGLMIYCVVLLSEPISNFIIACFMSIADGLMKFVSGNPVNNNISWIMDLEILEQAWTSVANEVGYLPVLILSTLDNIAQFLFYFFLGGLFLHIVTGKVLLSLWSVSLISDKFTNHAYQSIISWMRSLATLSAVPVVYMLSNLMIASFSSYGNAFLVISLSIASFLYVPLISHMILAKSNISQSGVFKPLFGGYQVMLETINSSLTNVRNVIELEKAKNV